jgi:hypothetical protein
MLYFLTSKEDESKVNSQVKMIIETFLNNNPQIGFNKGMIHLVYFLLCYSSEECAYYLFNHLFS